MIKVERRDLTFWEQTTFFLIAASSDQELGDLGKKKITYTPSMSVSLSVKMWD